MEVSRSTRDGATVIALIGDLDSGTAPQALAGLEQFLPGAGQVVLDMTRMSYMSSAGLRVLLLAHRQARRDGIGLILAGVPASVRETMSATGFLDFFQVADSVDDAVGAVRK